MSETRTKGKPHRRRIAWRLGEVIEIIPETPRTKNLILGVPGWEGHKAGHHVDVRLTAPDGYQAQLTLCSGFIL